jgi:hypothetical protein
MIIDYKTGAPARWHPLQIAAYEHLDCSIVPEFDEATHTYRLDGRVIPSVTQILSDMGEISEFSKQSPRARDLGLAVHAGCALLPDRLDWSTVQAEIMGDILSCMTWLERMKFEIEAQEQRGVNRELWYAGTLDLRGVIPPINYQSGGTLYLQDDGSLATLKVYDSHRIYWGTFVSMVNVWNWMEKHGDFRRKNGD